MGKNRKRLMIEGGILLVIVVAAFIIAFLGRKSHPDMYGELTKPAEEGETYTLPDGYEYYVCELQTGIIDHLMETWKRVLPESPVIIACTIVQGQEKAFGGVRAKVRVDKVFKAEEEIKTGEEFYVTNGAWRIYQDGKNRLTLEYKFHNLLKPGEQYLMFLTGKLDLTEEKYGTTYAMEGFSMAPIFLYEDRENVIIEVSQNNPYVSYNLVKDNDVFFSDKGELERYLSFKKEILEQYPLT